MFSTRKLGSEMVTVLFEDAHVLLIDKPAGLLSIPDRFDPSLPCLVAELRQKHGEIFVVHRLDRDTTGVIAFAKTSEAHRSLNLQFESHTARKKYRAIVDGVVVSDSGTIDVPLMEHPRRKGMMCIATHDGKAAVTRYLVLNRFAGFTQLELELETGRQHQIRVHCASIGHPLAVDPMYGKRAALFLSEFKRKYKGAGVERPLLGRLSLHAESLTFVHPLTQARMTFHAPLPDDFRTTLRQLEKWA